MIKLHQLLLAVFAAVALPLAHGKLPAPSPEAKAKADEAKAKTAWTDKVGAYKLCLSMERAAAHYYKTSGKDAKAATATPACADPGAFVYDPNAAATATVAAAAPAAAPAKPLEAAGAHSPAGMAVSPPSSKGTAAEQAGSVKK